MGKVIIIGGGISGMCSAYYLVKEGHQVTVIEKGDTTSGASLINAGYLTPSHFIPLAEPGVITKGLKWMLNSSSPFYIKPRFDWEFFKWSWHFKKSATPAKVEKAIPVLKEVSIKSTELFNSIEENLDFDFHYEKQGILTVYKNQKNEEREVRLAEMALKEGLNVKVLNGDEVRKLQPVFTEDIIGAVHYECDAHTTPGNFIENLKKWLVENGVQFKLNQEVEEIEAEGDRIIGVKTSAETFSGDEFVLAAGSWTFPLAKKLNLRIPIQGGKGYSMNLYRPTGITVPAILAEAKVAVTPMKGFTRFAGTMEFSGNNNIIRKNRVDAIANLGSSYFKDLTITEEERATAKSGLRPVSPDGLPYIGRPGKYKNLVVASGHAMIGWSLGPITGKLVSEIISGKEPSVNLTPFDPDRFS